MTSPLIGFYLTFQKSKTNLRVLFLNINLINSLTTSAEFHSKELLQITENKKINVL